MVYRANRNLSKMSDKELVALVETCVSQGVEPSEIDYYAERWQGGRSRKTVVRAAVAIDSLDRKLTKRIVIAPSDESRMWSNLEGGHTFFEKPDMEAVLFGK